MYNKKTLVSSYKVSFIMLILINLYYIIRSFSDVLFICIAISLDLTFGLLFYTLLSNLKNFKIEQPIEEQDYDEEEGEEEYTPEPLTMPSDNVASGEEQSVESTTLPTSRSKNDKNTELKNKQNKSRKTLDISALDSKSNKERIYYFDDLLESTYKTGETQDIVTAFSQREAERRNQLC